MGKLTKTDQKYLKPAARLDFRTICKQYDVAHRKDESRSPRVNLVRPFQAKLGQNEEAPNASGAVKPL